MPFSILLHLYSGSQCTYSYYPMVILPVLITIFFPSHWLLFHIVKKWRVERKEWIPSQWPINPQKECWPAITCSQVLCAVDWGVRHFHLTLSQTTNFGLFQIERLCRRQFQITWKLQKVLLKGRKHCGKRRNWSLRAISPFPSVFSKDLYCRRVKTRACLGKG